MTFLDDIEEILVGEPVEAIVVGQRTYDFDEDVKAFEPRPFTHHVKLFLDYEYDCGFGIPDCHAIVIWTATRIITIREYDGATALQSVPRHPVPCVPTWRGAKTRKGVKR